MRQQITEEYAQQLTKMNVAGFDPAAHFGFYNPKDYGVQYFPNTDKAPKKYGADYGKYKNLREWMVDYLTRNDIKAVASEDVIFGHFVDFRALCMIRGVMFEVCETLNIPIITFKPSDIKKHGTGNGNASKALMIEFAEKRYHIETDQLDDLADAIHIYMYFVHRYKLK